MFAAVALALVVTTPTPVAPTPAAFDAPCHFYANKAANGMLKMAAGMGLALASAGTFLAAAQSHIREEQSYSPSAREPTALYIAAATELVLGVVFSTIGHMETEGALVEQARCTRP